MVARVSALPRARGFPGEVAVAVVQHSAVDGG